MSYTDIVAIKHKTKPNPFGKASHPHYLSLRFLPSEDGKSLPIFAWLLAKYGRICNGWHHEKDLDFFVVGTTTSNRSGRTTVALRFRHEADAVETKLMWSDACQ